ncbi:hypothetical protein [Agrobacterium rosae]
MLTVNSFSNAAALTLLNGSNQNSVSSYLNSSVFKAKSSEIFGAISTAMSSAELQKDFKAYYERAMDSGSRLGAEGMHPDNGKHIALVDVIMEHRTEFPSEEFTIHTDFPDGASITTTIPSVASMKGDLFAADIAKKQAAYDEAIALENAEPDPELVKINAMAQVVKTLMVDAQDPDTSVTLLHEREHNPGRGYEQEQ